MKMISKKLALKMLLGFFLSGVLYAVAAPLAGQSQTIEDGLKVVTANINLMPKGLNIVTSDDPNRRAGYIADSLLKQHPGTDIYYLQELYDDIPSDLLINKLKKAGYDYYPGPSKQQLKTYWRDTYSYALGVAKNSGQGIFVKKDSGLIVESYDVFAFIEAGIEGIGLLETCVPKGVIHIKVSHAQEGHQPVSLFGYHLQAEIGFFALGHMLQGNWKEIPQTIVSDLVHLLPSQKIREQYPNYLEQLRSKQITAAMRWIERLEANHNVAQQRVHCGDFNLIAGSSEYLRLLNTMQVVAATDRTDLVTIGNKENTTWNPWLRPLYHGACKYVNNYGWMDLMLVNADLKKKVKAVEVVDLKNPHGKSVTDHESVALILANVF